MSEQKKKKRKAYLDSFQKDCTGNYIYKGGHYLLKMEGGELHREMILLWALHLAMMAVLVASGCVDGPGTGRCFYVLMPCVIAMISGGSVCWAFGRMTAGRGRLRVYIYEATARQIPGRAVFTAVCAGAAILGELVYLVRNGSDGKVGGCAVFLVLEGTAAALALIIKKRISLLKWEKKDGEMA